MPERSEVAYFGAGPARLRSDVLEDAAKALLNFKDTGISLGEISHRSSDANKILADFTERITKLLSIPDDYQVILAHGGGTGSFASTVFNMVSMWVEQRRRQAEKDLGAGKEAEVIERVRKEVQTQLRLDYLVTGSWSLKASQEATNLLEPLSKQAVNMTVDARKSNNGKFGTIPPESEWQLSPKGSAMIYYCDNETVDGVEFPSFPSSLAARGPEGESNVVADVSSNFLSRAMNVRNYAVIFGGAQKNIGMTDLTILIVRKSILETQAAPSFLHAVGVWSPPSIMNWALLAKNNSLYNTLPILSIYVASLTLQKSLAEKGPLSSGKQAEESETKAKLLYNLLEKNEEKVTINPSKDARSRMNICFRFKDEEMDKAFLKGTEARNMLGLKGHRSVGGIRVSAYNAVSIKNVEKLRDYLEEFLKTI